MAIKMTIKSKKDEIVLDGTQASAEITDVKFDFDSPDNAKEKANDAIIGLEINGKLNPDTYKNTKKLADWALNNETELVYREVTVQVRDGDDGVIIREYTLNKAFVVDYSETIASTGQTGTFFLKIYQKLSDKGVIVEY